MKKLFLGLVILGLCGCAGPHHGGGPLKVVENIKVDPVHFLR